MPRKPVIFLFLLLLFLSIGGAITYHQIRKDPARAFTEVDTFLRQGSLPADWRFVRHQSAHGSDLSSGWTKLIVQHKVHFQEDSYFYRNDRTSHEIHIYVTREDGKISRMEVAAGAMYLKSFKDHVFGKFPELRQYDLNAK